MKHERLNQLIQSAPYREAYESIQELECRREFCRHDIHHFLDVARIAWIYNLEENYNLSQEIVYSAAFLHDIGRHLQYTNNIPHDEASAMLAVPMMKEHGYSAKEIESIKQAILFHRGKGAATSDNPLAHILCRADKDSRSCHICAVSSKCNWEEHQKNMYITY